MFLKLLRSLLVSLFIFSFFLYGENNSNNQNYRYLNYSDQFNNTYDLNTSTSNIYNKTAINLSFNNSERENNTPNYDFTSENYKENNISGSKLKQFGYDFFYKSPKSFITDQTVPVTPDYVIGPGDQIVLTLWGRINDRLVLDVSREGLIYLPKMGVVNVAGVSFKDLRDFLKKEISKYYTDFDINVSMGNLRLIRVYIVGNVSHPGAYTINGLSTIITALFESGGPSNNGTMRAVELKRNGKTISVIDLYDFLIKGDKTNDVKLINEDTIFVPPVGKLVTVVNGVKNPAVYELKPEEKLKDLIKISGGFLNTTYNKKIFIKRIFNNVYRDYVTFDISDIEENEEKNIALEDGDIITFDIVTDFDTSVNVNGAVLYPGKVGIKQGQTTLSDAIKFAGGVLENASDTVEVTRFNKTEKGIVTERFELSYKKAISNDENHNIKLQPYDNIFVKNIPEWNTPKFVEVSGEINSPGVYVIKKGERFSSVLKRAGGFTQRAYPQGVIFIRESVRLQQQKNIDEIVQRLERELLSQSGTDISTSLSQEEVQSKKAVFEQKQKFLEKLRKLKATGRVMIKLSTIDKLENTAYDIELEEGDKIIIPSKSDVVNVSGAVMAEGSYVYKKSSYTDYIDMAGGYSSYADKGRTFILRADGSAVKARKFLFFSTRVNPGDTVVVPEKFETVAWLREIRDITQIIINLALSAGVVIKVF